MSGTIKLNFFSSKIFKSKVLQNFSYLMAGSVISQTLGMIALIKITRILAPADYGIYAFLLGQGFLLTTLGDLGVRSINIPDDSQGA
ncbi:MAG: oligosaccharide flippase family protein [Bacteroidota bacterium]